MAAAAPSARRRVAVVGAGVSGLVAALRIATSAAAADVEIAVFDKGRWVVEAATAASAEACDAERLADAWPRGARDSAPLRQRGCSLITALSTSPRASACAIAAAASRCGADASARLSAELQAAVTRWEAARVVGRWEGVVGEAEWPVKAWREKDAASQPARFVGTPGMSAVPEALSAELSAVSGVGGPRVVACAGMARSLIHARRRAARACDSSCR
jgi:hypothetical protein